MEEKIIINIIKTRLKQNQKKNQIKTAYLFRNLDPNVFERCYNLAFSEHQKVKTKQKRNRQKLYGRKLSFRVPDNTYKNFEQVILTDVKFNPKNKSHNYRAIFEDGIKAHLKKLGLDWEDAE